MKIILPTLSPNEKISKNLDIFPVWDYNKL